jgi:hypothetical protein
LATTSSTFHNSLRLQVDGLVGATKYCDVTGANCFTAASTSKMITDGGSGTSGAGSILLHSFSDTNVGANWIAVPAGTTITPDSYIIPANTFAAGDVVRVTAGFQVGVNASNAANATITLPGGTIITIPSGAADGAAYHFFVEMIGTVKASSIEFSSSVTKSQFGTSNPVTHVVKSAIEVPFTLSSSNALSFKVSNTGGFGGVFESFDSVLIERVTTPSAVLPGGSGMAKAGQYCDSNGVNCFSTADIASLLAGSSLSMKTGQTNFGPIDYVGPTITTITHNLGVIPKVIKLNTYSGDGTSFGIATTDGTSLTSSYAMYTGSKGSAFSDPGIYGIGGNNGGGYFVSLFGTITNITANSFQISFPGPGYNNNLGGRSGKMIWEVYK